MYWDEETQRYYSSADDCRRVKVWTDVQQGLLRQIAGFSRYAVTPVGEVININRARLLTPYLNAGRLAVGLVNDLGQQKTLGLARLVATHFIGEPSDDQYYDVVHLNGDVTDVHPSNLQWQPRWKRHANPGNYNLDIS